MTGSAELNLGKAIDVTQDKANEVGSFSSVLTACENFRSLICLPVSTYRSRRTLTAWFSDLMVFPFFRLFPCLLLRSIFPFAICVNTSYMSSLQLRFSFFSFLTLLFLIQWALSDPFFHRLLLGGRAPCPLHCGSWLLI
jgi:hypothetical protein